MLKDQKKVNVRLFLMDKAIGKGGESRRCRSKGKWEELCRE